MQKATIRDINVTGKRILVRVDFNVPLDKKGNITNDTRIVAALPTIKYLMEHNAKIILMSHLGRPDGDVMPEYKMDPVAKRLGELLGVNVIKLDDCIGEEVETRVNQMKEKEVILLENLRFHKGETKNDPEFAKSLAKLGDIYVNDAFGTAHRAHASTAGVASYLPAVAGFLMEKEVEYLGKVLHSPERPLVAVLGGSKVSDKIAVMENLIPRVDYLIVGGGMAFTFLKINGFSIGKSLLDPNLEPAKNIITKCKEKGVKLLLPVDVICATEIKEGIPVKEVSVENIPDDMMGLDIGTKTIQLFEDALKNAKTVMWNGPMGVFELSEFANGTNAIAEYIAGLQATTVVGGGDSVAAVDKLGISQKFTHVSTGGGASLEFLEGKELPGVAVLKNAVDLAKV